MLGLGRTSYFSWDQPNQARIHTGFHRFMKICQIFHFFFFGIEKENFKLSKLKSGKWFGQSVNMLSEWLRNPGKGTFGELKSKKTIPEGVCPQTFLEVRNRSVFILDPRLQT